MKRRMFFNYLKDTFLSLRLYTAILIVIAAIWVEFSNHSFTDVKGIIGICMAWFSKMVMYTPPAFAFIVTSCDDSTNQYLRPIVIRSGVRKYTITKFAAGFISALIVVFAGVMLASYLLTFKIPLLDPDNPAPGYPFDYFITIGHPWITSLIEAFIFAVYGAMYACFGLAVSAALPNKFVAMAVPPTLCFIFDEISWAFDVPWWINIQRLSDSSIIFEGEGTVNMLMTFGWKVFFALALTAVAYAVYEFLIFKRVKCEINN